MPNPDPAFRVLFADAALLAVDKPSGLHTAPLHPGETDNLLALVTARHPEVAGLPGIKPTEPGLLHRLDRDTSGVVLIARTAEAFRDLRAQFRAGAVRKEYLAACIPRSPVRAGQRLVVESRFAPFGPGRRKVRVVPLTGGGDRTGGSPARRGRGSRRATAAVYRTEAEVLEVRGGVALVRAVIARGFRHQVRAHLAHVGLPLVGDPLYGAPWHALQTAAPLAPDAPARLGLHASAIELRRPGSGERLRIDCPLPTDFALWYGGSSAEVV